MLLAALSLFSAVTISAAGPQPGMESKLTPRTDDGPSSSTYGPILYDPAGNIVAIGASYYVYDQLRRVKTAAVEHDGYLQSQTYTYDIYGNRTSDGVDSASVNATTNRLTSFGATYDAAGNLASWQPAGSAAARHYRYDLLNLMQYEEVDAVRSRHHVYTADDQRFWTLTGRYDSSCPNGICSESQLSLRDLGGRLLREFTDDGGASAPWRHQDYLYRQGQLLATVTPAGAQHYSLDHLGTPRVVTAQDGYEVARHAYFPFGAEITDGSPTDGRLRFTGHEERDRDVAGEVAGELDYMHARFHSARLGRFLSVDPGRFDVTNPQSWNRYSYVLNNPLNALDPDGRETILLTDRYSWGNPFGHSAIAINGRVYSYGTNRISPGVDWGVDQKAYMAAESGLRETVVSTLIVTPEQEQALQTYLDANQPSSADYNLLMGNTCVAETQNALIATGIIFEPPVSVDIDGHELQQSRVSTPDGLLDRVTAQGLVSSTTVVGTKPDTSWWMVVLTTIEDMIRR
ncbi:MAG TPA: RHS repeat-associated core domain-containing protein [Thermoanaerobaculia bacterium]|nr:RHS repeat-associated core domain-containing protein [Thermoanaerobaculia bacterium]